MMPPEYINQIVTGDARALAERIPDNSIDLIFTDPVYSERPLYDWLGAAARRILKPAGALLCWSNGKWHRTNANWLEAAGLVYRWDFGCVNNDRSAPMDGKIISKTNRLIWLDVDAQSHMCGYLADGYISIGGAWIIPKENFGWGKSNIFSMKAIEAFAQRDAIIFDPFAGYGTLPAVAKLIHRNYIAFEIDPDTAERARARVANTQAIHPLFLEEQEILELA